jgi:hypothetical protein
MKMQMQMHTHAHPHDQIPWHATTEVEILAVPAVLTTVEEARLPEWPGAILWGERLRCAVKKQC